MSAPEPPGSTESTPATEQRAAFLRQTQLFGAVPEAELLAFAEAFVPQSIPGGASQDCHGLEADSLYVVYRGRVRVEFVDAHGTTSNTIELGRGRFFGELGLLGGGNQRARIFAVRDSELLAISRADLRAVAVAHPESLWSLTHVVIERMAAVIRGESRRGSPIEHIACLPLVDSADAREAIADLARALATLGPTLHISPERIRERFGPQATDIGWADDRNREVTAWLHEQSVGHRWLLFEGTPERDEWSLRCLREAERIVLVAPAGAEPNLDGVRQQFKMRDRCCISEVRLEALLLHARDARYPTGAASWKRQSEVARIHHLRLGDPNHYARVARCLTQRGVGVVLGGGGARGVAQVGILKALEEAGIPVDLIGGTSIGSIFAAGHAMGWSADEIMERVREVFRRRAALIDLTFPYLALLSGGKLTRVLRKLFGDMQAENLWHDYYCVSVGLNDATIHAHDRGDLWRNIRSSCALPGIFPPVHAGDDVLIDGGVMNNLPTDIMAQRAEGGPVIAIDVSGASRGTGRPFGSQVSGWRELTGKLNPLSGNKERDRTLHIFDVLLGSTVVSSRSKRNQELHHAECSLYLRPPVERFGVLDFRSFQELYDIGYEYGRQALEGWEPPVSDE